MRLTRFTWLRSVVVLVGAIGFGAMLPSAFGDQASQPGPTVTREALAQATRPQGAPHRTLTLSKVTIPPGAELALHHHLGTQAARVTSGVLTYMVERGSVTVRSGEAEEQPKVVRSIKAGQTGRIPAGQWIVEQPSTIHRAANHGSVPVVVYLATLLESGAPPATPVTLPE
jgi:quercetin dioxygenase-like cupin family protein